MPDGETYGAVISRNILAARARARLKQSEVAARMRALGYSWHPQTVGEVENSNRRVTAEEILGLARALETDVPSLLLPLPTNGPVRLPGGQALDRTEVETLILGYRRGPARWEGRANLPPSTDDAPQVNE